MGTTILDELAWRGLIAQSTDLGGTGGRCGATTADRLCRV